MRGSSGLCGPVENVVSTAELFDCGVLADLLWGFTSEYAAFCEAGPFLSLVFPAALEMVPGVLVGEVGQADGPCSVCWSAVPRLWMPEFGWALERAYQVLRQVIDAPAPAPLVNAYLDAITDAANTQWRAPLEVLAQHLRRGSGRFSDGDVALNVAGFALPLEFALEILEGASLPLGRRPASSCRRSARQR